MTFKYADKISLLGKYVDIFSALHVSSENQLTQREKEFFIANVILNSYGIDLVSRKASSILEKQFGFINRGVSIYRMKLKEKGWMFQTGDSIVLPKAFDYKTGIPEQLTFSFTVKLEEPLNKEINKEIKNGQESGKNNNYSSNKASKVPG